MDELEKQGHEAIAQAVESLEPPVLMVEMLRQLGDVLHSSVVVRHIRATQPDARVVWAISKLYGQTFEAFTPSELGPHALALLPLLPLYPADGPYRIRWVEQAKTLPKVSRAFGCGVHPWGQHTGGSIVDGILYNAGIARLAVPRRPWLPIDQADLDFADQFISAHGLTRFVAMEYSSYSLPVQNVSWYSEFVRIVGVPVVAVAGTDFPPVPGAIDGRHTTFRQAKAIISRSSCFLGACSGLSVIAASHGCEQPVVEIGPRGLSMTSIGYRTRAHHRHRVLRHGVSPRDVSLAVRELVLGIKPKTNARRKPPKKTTHKLSNPNIKIIK